VWGLHATPAGAAVNVYAHTLPGEFSPAVRGIPERVYVPNSESGSVSVINPSTFRVIRTFATGYYDQHVTPGWSLRRLYVDDTDEKALDVALARAARAYEGFLPPPKPGETFEERVREHAKKFIGRGEPGASEIMANLFDADYLMKNELVFIGSAKTVAEKIHAAAKAGLFNVFMGEFNFSDLPENDLLRSIRLFGEQVIPALRSYEPF